MVEDLGGLFFHVLGGHSQLRREVSRLSFPLGFQRRDRFDFLAAVDLRVNPTPWGGAAFRAFVRSFP